MSNTQTFNELTLIKNSKSNSPICSNNQGNIYDSHNNIVCRSITRNLQSNRDLLKISRYYDGIYINFFYYNGMWNYATTSELDNNRKIIKTRSLIEGKTNKTVNKSLNQLLGDYEGLIDLFGKLNKKYNYGFLLCHPEVSINYLSNDFIKTNDKTELIHLYTFNTETNREININIEGIKKPEIYYDGVWLNYELFDDLSELYPIIEINYESFKNDIQSVIESKLELPFYFKGITIEYGTNREHIIRPAFKTIKKIINSNSDFYILEAIKREDIIVLNAVNELYSLRIISNESYNLLSNLIEFIDKLEFYYKMAYVNKKYIDIPEVFRHCIYELHGKYLMRRRLGEKFIIDYQFIKKYIFELDSPLLITLIRKYQKIIV